MDQASKSHQQAAVVRSRIYKLLAELLTYPDNALRDSIRDGQLDAQVVSLLATLPYSLSWEPTRQSETSTGFSLQSEYMRVFELPSDGQPCALYGGIHAGDRKTVMEELLRYYRHFGLSTANAPDQDLPDSVQTVLEFLHFLCVRESMSADEDQDSRQAQRDVLSRHLCGWLPSIDQNLRDRQPIQFYLSVMDLLGAFCRAELERL